MQQWLRLSTIIEARPLATLKDLKPDPRNARTRTDRSASLIQESLQRFGAARSIVIDEDGRILAGNGTVEGAKAAGISKVRIIETEGDEIVAVRRTGLTEEQKIGLALADNRTSDLSEWDGLMLQQLSEDHDLTPWFDPEDLEAITSGSLLEDGEEEAGSGGPDAAPRSSKLADRFGIPPFSVLNAREGRWQDRKRAWLSLGIKSELGRGAAIGGAPLPMDRQQRGGGSASPGGSMMPAADYGRSKARGDGRGRAVA